MKKIQNIITLSLLAGAMGLTGCNDSFMQEDPTQNMIEGTFLSHESDLPLFLNQFYDPYIEGHQSGYAESATRANAPFGETIRQERLVGWDKMTDNALLNGTNKSANNAGVCDPRLNGTFVIPQNGTTTGWEWNNLKAINYFLTHYQAAAKGGDVSKLDPWKAEAYFFKAWDYYDKVVIFGEVPWYDIALTTESPELYNPRTPRVELLNKLLETIQFAVDHLPDNDNPIGRINKDMANFLKARICLFEGSFRLYHSNLNLPDYQKFLTECVKACEAIINSGHYELYDPDNVADPYWKLFTFKKTPAADGEKEAILARVYDGVNVGTAFQRYFDQNQPKKYGCFGASKGMVDEYLCIDGKTISESLKFEGYDGWYSELNNRDPRLTQTVCRPGEYISIWRNGGSTAGIKDEKVNGIICPIIGSKTNASTVGGYRVIKHWMGDIDEYNSTTKGTQTAIVFRYADVLLMLAEAKAILGTITQSDIDNTINKLRIRAGFDFVKYPNSKLVIGQEPADPRLDAIYAAKLDYTVSPLIREIRRERRVEMAWEGMRYTDLIRWKAGKLMTVPMRGMKMTQEKQNWYSVARLLDTSKTDHTGERVVDSGTVAIKDRDYYLDADGFIIAYPNDPKISNGVLPWDDKRYYWPIPLQELELNKNLTQSSYDGHVWRNE